MPVPHAARPAAMPPLDPARSRPRLGAAPALLRAIPHLGAFWPEAETVALRPGMAGLDHEWVAEGAVPRGDVAPLRFTPGPFAPPRFGRRQAPPILFAAPGVPRDPLGALLARAVREPPADAGARGRAAALRDLLAEARPGAAGLPDPGPPALGCGRGEAVIVVDPCDPARAVAARRLWLRAASRAEGRPVRAVRSPDAAPDAPATLPNTLPSPLAPWTILESAAELHLLDGPLGLLGAMAGVAVHADPRMPWAPWAAGGSRDGLDLLAVIAAGARCADPFRHRPWRFEQALELLADWRRAEAENARIAVCVGMSFWKRARVAAALASEHGEPAFRRTTSGAVAAARRRGGAIAVWASRCPRDLPARTEAAGVPIRWVEDGFIRSAGLGAGFLPAASLILDSGGPHYDPGVETELERLLATARFPPALIARAESLIAALRDRQVTKYNLAGPSPALPPRDGRPRILVPGQVADDLSVLRGATGPVRGDASLLRAARDAAPDAFLIYKPHPDVVAGYRRGGLREAEARRFADLVLANAPMAPLLEAVDGVHTLTSLTGFEALLRGRAVTVWGQPFYAGWGLTSDRLRIPRRRRRLTLAELVAGALILHPRYLDPVTELPCPPEVLLDRLADPAPWRAGPLMRLRRWQGGALRLLRRAVP
ncbi:MAG TPA: capsular biosynthesis protein [Acetobacteraceae bacterium]|nr:capsular biosynthesis protein [Acetobacteraceae bacterium]